LTDSKKLTKWFLSKAKLVPKKGGAYSFDWFGGYHMTGKVKQFDPNKAVSFSWTDKLKSGQVANTTASFKVAKKGKGTLLELRHTGFKDPEHFADCSSRWGILFDQHEIGSRPRHRSPVKIRLVDRKRSVDPLVDGSLRATRRHLVRTIPRTLLFPTRQKESLRLCPF
jgi:hypothetical protein